MPVVTDSGFVEATPLAFRPWDDRPEQGSFALDLSNTADASAILPELERIQAIRIGFPNASDGRGFSLARHLRNLGFRGRLRAQGHVISDQYRYARSCGFDEVEISEDLAHRQPEQDWRSGHDTLQNYRQKLTRRPADDIVPEGILEARVTQVHHYTDRLFSFRVTRPQSLRFQAGQFAMIGLPAVDGEKPVYRAYSIASPVWDDSLEFYSIKVPGGPLTERLQHIQTGDSILVRPKTTGTLLNEALEPGERLWLFSSGTGIAPFASILSDPETYERFGRVILTHTVRTRAELAYAEELVARIGKDPLVGTAAREQLKFYPTTTREDSRLNGRITDRLTAGDVFADLEEVPINAAQDRAMICGSMAMLNDVKRVLTAVGLKEGTTSRPAGFVVERAFVG